MCVFVCRQSDSYQFTEYFTEHVKPLTMPEMVCKHFYYIVFPALKKSGYSKVSISQLIDITLNNSILGILSLEAADVWFQVRC